MPCSAVRNIFPLGVAALVLLTLAPRGFTQEPTLKIDALSVAGLRLSVTESSNILDFVIENPTNVDRQGRVLAFFETDPDSQYGKDFWIPAQARLEDSMLLGPVPKENSNLARSIQYLLYDLTDGTEKLIRPRGEEIRRGRGLFYQKRETTTVLFLDSYVPPEPPLGALPQPLPPDLETVHFVQLLRSGQGLPVTLNQIYGKRLPATQEAFAGIDHFVLASNQLARDAVGLRALRHWVRQGGTLWVMLDKTDPEMLGTLLEDTLDFRCLPRVSLDQFAIESNPKSALDNKPFEQRHERPVDFVRVALPEGERVPLSLDGWPVLFTRRLGQGNVVFTTLGPRAAYRTRVKGDTVTNRDPNRTSDDALRQLPVPNSLVRVMAAHLRKPGAEKQFPVAEFGKALGSQIGYAVAPRSTVAFVFGLFLLVELLLGWWLPRLGRAMLLLWLTPLVAVAAGALFLILGASAHRAEPTTAVGEIVNAIGNRSELTVHGLLASYRPEAGKLSGSADAGGWLDLDRKGLEGQIGRRLMTDHDAWHWENLATPAGVRLSPFHFVAPTREPIEAILRFTPNGLEGKLKTGDLLNVSDAVLCGPGDRRVAASLGRDGAVEVRARDMLAETDFFQSTTLSDRQQRRLGLVREFTRNHESNGHKLYDDFEALKGDHFLLAWADPIATPLERGLEGRRVGEAMLLIPVRFERPPAGSKFTVPATCMGFSRILDGMSIVITRDTDRPADLLLRFQIPKELLPVKLTEARFAVKISAPSREVVVKSGPPGKATEFHRVSSPLDAIRVAITDHAALTVDEDGGVRVLMTISDLFEPMTDPTLIKPLWKIDFVELEVSGETLP